MVYRMNFRVDGACRGNGRPRAVGAAACVRYLNRSATFSHRHSYTTKVLPDRPTPTNQRAEIQAIVLALEWAFEKADELGGRTELDVIIYSDSKYAVGCMNEWIDRWRSNGWRNSKGDEVANKDLIKRASKLHDQIDTVRYIWVRRSENAHADRICNEALDKFQG